MNTLTACEPEMMPSFPQHRNITATKRKSQDHPDDKYVMNRLISLQLSVSVNLNND